MFATFGQVIFVGGQVVDAGDNIDDDQRHVGANMNTFVPSVVIDVVAGERQVDDD